MINNDTNDESNIYKYKTTELYKTFDDTNENRKEFFIKSVKSYENFIKFLKSDTDIINYSYLWDIISSPNPLLFPLGLNLVIIELTNNDITDNVNIICPTNHYSSEFYDIDKKTLIILKNDDYYEPIYTYEDKKNKFEITRLFSLRDETILPNIKATLEVIKSILNNNCGPLPSLPKVYNLKENIVLNKLIFILQDNDYKILKQVLNYNGKVIGVIATKNDLTGFIPCFPSSIIIDIGEKIQWIDDTEWNTYSETKDFLSLVNVNTKNQVPTKPMFKVLEDGLIIGIITETNQFVGIDPVEQDTYGNDLESLNENNHINADIDSLLTNKKDNKRINAIKNIKLETGFYNAFRNTIRILIGQKDNRNLRKELESTIDKKFMLYNDKLVEIISKLRELTQDSISFIEYDKSLIEKLNNITSCIVNDNTDCREKEYCLLSDDDICKLQIPKVNLINLSDNEEIYYGKMADELIRYSRIKGFIFQPQAFLSFSTIKYNLQDDEVIVFGSSLNNEYFTNMIPINETKYVNQTSYDIVNPQKSVRYSSEYISDSQSKNIKKSHKIVPKLKLINETINDDTKPFISSILPQVEGIKELTPKELTPKELTPKELTPKELTPKELTPSDVNMLTPRYNHVYITSCIWALTCLHH